MRVIKQCEYCGTKIEIDEIKLDTHYICPVCHSLVYRKGQPFQYVFFISLTSLILFFWMLNMPLISIKIMGIERSTTFISGLGHLIESGRYLTAFILGLSVIVIPYTMLILTITIVFAVRLGIITPFVFKLLYLYENISMWNMAEVYLVGIFIAIIKLKSIAEISIGYGTIVFILFLSTFYVSVQWFNPEDVMFFCGKDQCLHAGELYYNRGLESG